MTRADQARAHCTELRKLWLAGDEQERETISAEISALTQRPAFSSLSDRVLAEMKGNG